MSRIFVCFRVVLAAALLLIPLSVQALTLDEVLARNLAARGGEANLKAIKSLRMNAKALFGDGDWALEAVFGFAQKRGATPDKNQMRDEVTLQGLTAVSAYDGQNGWNLEPFGGRRDAQKASADECKGLARDADIDGPLIDWQAKGHQLEYMGTEDIDGTLAHKIRVQHKGGDTQIVYLDPTAFLEIRIVTIKHVRGAERISETDLGSYAQINGVWMPLSSESGSKGRPRTSRITYEFVEVNVDLPDSLFQFPAAGTPIVRALAPAAGAVAVVGAAPAGAKDDSTPPFDSGVISGLGARNIGSAAMSGRVSSVAAYTEGGKTTVFVAAASGGVWKSRDGGTTFKPVFDKQNVQSIGAIAIDPTKHGTIWVGSGEAWTRNSVSIGDGIYKSTDGGETWNNMGLPESERIVKIIVHPKNSDIVYACSPGKLWSDSADRGLYKTMDGGKTWHLILKGSNLSTGCSGVTLDPTNPEVILAGLWDFRRKGWTFRSGGEGPEVASGSGLMKSIDGGANWTAINASSNKGLPEGPWGRVEVVYAPSDNKIVYAFIENKQSALYRSSDGGLTWEARDKSMGMVWRPFYFARLVVDPKNPERIFKPDMGLIVSDDGGKSFSNSNGRSHGDWHDVWIDPDNTQHLVGGDDGGFWASHDGGSRWHKSNNLPISQFYHVSVDMKDPYQVYGGLQDNSSWAGDSAHPGGITNQSWENLYNSDGFWTLVDPTDPNGVYAEGQGGYIARIDRKTHTARDIQPKAGLHEKLRFNWNTPLHLSTLKKGTLYMGAQFLFRSTDRGDNWVRISPDLTTNDPLKQKQELSGGITVDNSSAEMHTTIYTISESPKDAKVLWVGTDDGNVQLSKDAGKTWNNVVGNVAGLPKNSWVSWIEASRFDAGTAYAAFDRHTFGDMQPWIFKTTNYGQSWTRIASFEQGMRGYVHVIKEDILKPQILFAGTEFGLWISVDTGAHWAQFHGNGFPNVAVREVQVHPREHDLVIGTHGRGIWIIDDLSPLRMLTADVLNKPAAFLADRPSQQRMAAQGGWVEGDATFVGDNPQSGAVITYYQKSRHLYGPLKLEVLDAAGKVLETLNTTKRRGINRVAWSMQGKPPKVPRAAQLAFNASQAPRVLPGSYVVRLTKGAEIVQGKLEIGMDKRAPYTVDARKAQHAAAMRVHGLFEQMSALVEKIDATRNALQSRMKGLAEGDPLGKKLAATLGKIDEAKKLIVATKEGGAITGEERIREHLDILYGALIGWEGKPASYQVARIDTLEKELGEVAATYAKVLAEDVGPLNEELKAKNLAPIAAAPLAVDLTAGERKCAASRGQACQGVGRETAR